MRWIVFIASALTPTALGIKGDAFIVSTIFSTLFGLTYALFCEACDDIRCYKAQIDRLSERSANEDR